MGLTIALIHNLKPQIKDPHVPEDYYSECDSPKTVDFIADAIRSGGHKVILVEADRKLPQWLSENPIDLAFNIAEGFHGESREARVPALLELMEIPYTGSGVLSLALALNKAKTKQIFRSSGIPTPNFQLFISADEPINPRLKYPLIVKPNREGSAKGIWSSSVVRDEASLRAQIKRVADDYAQEILVEEYIEGTELTVGMVGDIERMGIEDVLPILEIDFSACSPSGEFFYSWRMKEFQGNEKLHLAPQFWCPARLDASTTTAIQGMALRAARAIGSRHMARVDIRWSLDGIPYVLEVNPLPGLDPEESNLPVMTKAAGIAYKALIHRIVDLAIEHSPRLSKKIPTTPVQPQDSGVASSYPLSPVNHPNAQAPRHRILPESMEKGSGSPVQPTVAVQHPVRRRPEAREDDPKEENLGR